MKAIICTKYGKPEVLQMGEVEKPRPKKNVTYKNSLHYGSHWRH